MAHFQGEDILICHTFIIRKLFCVKNTRKERSKSTCDVPMTNKKVFECSRNCKSCTYENKQCDGFDEFSECISDVCPSGNYAIGNIDEAGGKHTTEGNWNPIGERCSLCAPKNCINCDKWKRRQAENKTAPKPETVKKPSSNAAMWGAIFDDVYDLNDSPKSTTIVKEVEKEPETVVEDIKEPIIEETVEEVVEEIVESISTEEIPEELDDSAVAIEEPDIPDEIELPENIDIPEDIDTLTDIEDKVTEEKAEIQPVEEVKEQVAEQKPAKQKSVFDDDDFDYFSFKNATMQKWPNKPAIVISETKVEDESEENEEVVETQPEEIVSEESAVDEVVETATEVEKPKEVVEAKHDEDITTETESVEETPITIEPETVETGTVEEGVDEQEPESTQKKLFDTSLFSKWFKRNRQTETPAKPVEEVKIEDNPTNSEKPLDYSEKSGIIKEEDVKEANVETVEVVKNVEPVTPLTEKTIAEPEEDAENETPAYALNPEKNEYIKASWLDEDESQDYDENGNLIQGIYRIDKNGNRTIVTAFDDDTNVRYIKTNKPKIAVPVTSGGVRVVDTITDAWQVSKPEEDEMVDGIVDKTNQVPTAEVVEITPPEENPILDTPKDVDNQETEVEPQETTEEDEEDIDFGEDLSSDEDGFEFDDGYSDAMFEQDEIPEPDEYKAEREEYEEAGIEAEDAVEVDEEYEDADFDMTDSAKFKASLLTPIGEEIAKLQLNNTGVYLSVLGDCKITIKGRNDTDGFSYRDARRFPKYIIDKVLNKSIYRDPNMEVIDNTYFNLTYYEIKNGEIIPIDDVRLDVVFDNPTPDSVKEVLYNEYKKFKNE